MKRVLYDVNVILDVLLKREPHFRASATALDAVTQGEVEGYIAGHAITTIAYLIQRQLGPSKSRTVLTHLLSKMHVTPVTDSAIRSALHSRFSDFEDAVSHAVAEEARISVIVTRNVRDFSKSAVPVVLPEVFPIE